MKVVVLFVWICCSIGIHSFIIPDELPSLLSVIYSNIPTIKKGTDSRIGWGFRLGDRADFQVLVELGPQMNTQPLANQQDTGTSKRNALNNLANTLYAQRQQEKQIAKKKQKDVTKVSSDSNNDGAVWLNSWSKSVSKDKQKYLSPAIPANAKPGLGIGEIDAKSVIPDDSELEEQEEKRKILESMALSTSTEKVKSTTSKKDALDNVDLD